MSKEPKRIRAVVFDAFGTIVELGEALHPYRALIASLREVGRTVRPAIIARLMTERVDLVAAAKLLGASLDAQALASLEQRLERELGSIRLFPETIRTLCELRSRGVRMGVCSNLALPYAKPVEQLLPPMDAYAWSFEVGVTKPDPLIYEHVCRALGCHPGETLMVGDRVQPDVEGPRAFGMQSLLICRDGATTGTDVINSLDAVLARLDAENAPAHERAPSF